MTPIALTIAGSDPSGGAGVQADLKTFAALGVYGVSVLTALTAQNTKSVGAIHDLPPAFITAQLDALFADFNIRAVKIGMLSRTAVIDAVAARLEKHKIKNIVLDPVMLASSGDALLVPAAVNALRQKLIPKALVVTPNLPEAAALLGASLARNEREMEIQARELLVLGAKHVLIKGGHGSGDESVDLLVNLKETHRFAAKRIVTKNTHGSGCTFSSAIAAGLAKGLPLREAVRAAKDYVTGAIAAADKLKVGHGPGPLNHFYKFWRTL
jgi:hydroxymethylpyrimidine/phosphomethylpyrimidine kinase